MSIIIDH